jgi:hypothetical protein
LESKLILGGKMINSSFWGSKNYCFWKFFSVAALIILLFLAGCAPTMMETQKKGISSLTEKEYVIPKKPVDNHYIGWAWSKQFGPVEEPAAEEVQIKKEKSFNKAQQEFAYTVGFGVGGQTIAGPLGETGIRKGTAEETKMEGIEIITPVSLADVPFKPQVPYITEALRLANFKLQQEKAFQAGVNISASTPVGTASAVAGGGAKGRSGLEGEGLVVAYKLHRINPQTYAKEESGSQRLELDKAMHFAKAKVIVRARLQIIDPGAKRSLPRNLLWSCPRAEAGSRDMVAAWIVEIRPTDPKRKSLSIAFPAHPKVEDCYNYEGVIFSRIDPLSDKIIRQKVQVVIADAEVSDTMKPQKWDAFVGVIEESFNVSLVKPSEVGN